MVFAAPQMSPYQGVVGQIISERLNYHRTTFQQFRGNAFSWTHLHSGFVLHWCKYEYKSELVFIQELNNWTLLKLDHGFYITFQQNDIDHL
jgi:hypothetical protein